MLHVHNLWRKAPGRSRLENRNKEKIILKWLCKTCLLLTRIDLKCLCWRFFSGEIDIGASRTLEGFTYY